MKLFKCSVISKPVRVRRVPQCEELVGKLVKMAEESVDSSQECSASDDKRLKWSDKFERLLAQPKSVLKLHEKLKLDTTFFREFLRIQTILGELKSLEEVCIQRRRSIRHEQSVARQQLCDLERRRKQLKSVILNGQRVSAGSVTCVETELQADSYATSACANTRETSGLSVTDLEGDLDAGTNILTIAPEADDIEARKTTAHDVDFAYDSTLASQLVIDISPESPPDVAAVLDLTVAKRNSSETEATSAETPPTLERQSNQDVVCEMKERVSGVHATKRRSEDSIAHLLSDDAPVLKRTRSCDVASSTPSSVVHIAPISTSQETRPGISKPQKEMSERFHEQERSESGHGGEGSSVNITSSTSACRIGELSHSIPATSGASSKQTPPTSKPDRDYFLESVLQLAIPKIATVRPLVPPNVNGDVTQKRSTVESHSTDERSFDATYVQKDIAAFEECRIKEKSHVRSVTSALPEKAQEKEVSRNTVADDLSSVTQNIPRPTLNEKKIYSHKEYMPPLAHRPELQGPAPVTPDRLRFSAPTITPQIRRRRVHAQRFTHRQRAFRQPPPYRPAPMFPPFQSFRPNLGFPRPVAGQMDLQPMSRPLFDARPAAVPRFLHPQPDWRGDARVIGQRDVSNYMCGNRGCRHRSQFVCSQCTRITYCSARCQVLSKFCLKTKHI